MRSRHADAFNHDPWADDYDAKVRDESNPIRTGYASLLAWTVEQARIEATSTVLDLGAGTGNSAAAISSAGRVVCVDLSRRMIDQAPSKLGHLPSFELVVADLLEVFDRDLPVFDAVISTYSVHHLEEDEKAELIRRVFDVLRPGGRAVFGDLMFESDDARRVIEDAWNDEERKRVIRSLDDEFPWYLDRADQHFASVGFDVVATRRFSTLSWGVAVERPHVAA